MSGWAAKRFWKQAHVVPTEGGHAVHLDARPLRTPAKAPLVLPTADAAQAVAAEWDAQQEVVRPQMMPFTRAVNSAIDNVRVNHAAVAALVAAYGETDLLCYRAEAPVALRERQAQAWDPLLRWAEEVLDARLLRTEGVMFAQQPARSLAALRSRVTRFGPFGLTALHDLVTISGSLVIGLAAAEALHPAENLWDASRVDEIWQIEQWGEDADAAAQAAYRRQAFLEAERFLRLCTSISATA